MRTYSVLILLSCALGSVCSAQDGTHGPPAEIPPTDSLIFKPVEEVHNFDAQIGEFVRRILQDDKGHLWFGTNGFGVCRYDGERVTYFSTQDGLGGTQITGIQQDAAGDIWISNSGGVARFDGESITNYTTDDGLSSTSVWSLFIDRDGTVWAGTTRGICRFDGTRFVPFVIPPSPVQDPQSRFSPVLASSIYQDRDGNMWFGMDGTGVCKWDASSPLRQAPGNALASDDASFTYFTTQDGLCDNSIVCVLQDHSGHMWFSSRFGGVSRTDDVGVSFMNLTAPDDIGDNEVWTLFEDSSGAMWFVSEGFGIYRYDEGTLTNFAEDEGLPFLAPQCIFEDREGRFWVGGYGGLFRRDGDTFVNVTRAGPWGDKADQTP